MRGSVFLLQVGIPFDGHLHHALQFTVDFSNAVLERGNVVVGFLYVEADDASHADVEEAHDVVMRHLTHKRRLERLQPLVDIDNRFLQRLALLVALFLIDTLLDENLLQRSAEEALQQLVALDAQLRAEQLFRGVDAVAQHVADAQEVRLPVGNDAAVGRNAHLAVGKGIEGINRAVARCAGKQVDDDVGMLRRVVLHLAYLDFTLLLGLHD